MEILQKMLTPRAVPFKVTEVIGTHTDQSVTYDLLLMFRNNYGPISYRFGDKRGFLTKFANFSTLCI